jgi:hypothetical protein
LHATPQHALRNFGAAGLSKQKGPPRYLRSGTFDPLWEMSGLAPLGAIVRFNAAGFQTAAPTYCA